MILKDLRVGQAAEKEVRELLWYIYGIASEDATDRTYDFEARYNDISRKFEVKFDIMAARTGNVAIEIFNPKTNKPSGLYSSTADIWAYVFETDGKKQIYVCKKSELLDWINTVPPLRIVDRGGDNNATLMLYNKEDILQRLFLDITSLPEFFANPTSGLLDECHRRFIERFW